MHQSSSPMAHPPDKPIPSCAVTCAWGGRSGRLRGVWGVAGTAPLRSCRSARLSRGLRYSEVMFEFMPLSSAPGGIRTCAHGSGGQCCMTLLPGETCHSRPVGERMGSAGCELLDQDAARSSTGAQCRRARIVVSIVLESSCWCWEQPADRRCRPAGRSRGRGRGPVRRVSWRISWFAFDREVPVRPRC